MLMPCLRIICASHMSLLCFSKHLLFETNPLHVQVKAQYLQYLLANDFSEHDFQMRQNVMQKYSY